MSFTKIFGGNAVKPSDASYLPLALAVNTALVWPLETTAGSPVVAAMIDVTPASGGLSLAMPPGNTGSTGVATMITNVGASTFTLTDTSGNAIIAIAPSVAYLIALTDNSTTNGSWRALQMAATTSSANAAALAGPGLEASAGKLQTKWIPNPVAINTLLTSAFRANLVIWGGGSGGVLQLDTLANLTAGFYLAVYNHTAFDLQVTTSNSETINEGLSSIIVQPGESTIIVASTDFFVAMGILIGPLPIVEGGTGATDAPDALVNFGGTTLGIGLFTAPSAASARALLGLNSPLFTEVTVSTDQAVNSGQGNNVFVATTSINVTLPLSTTLTPSFSVGFSAHGGVMVIAPQASDRIDGVTAGVSYIVRQGTSVLMMTDANGNWWPVFLSLPTQGWWTSSVGGTADAIQASYAPGITSLVDGMLLGFRATGANTVVNPSFQPEALTAHTILRGGSVPLQVGDIPGAGAEMLVRYNGSLSAWELLNPAVSLGGLTGGANQSLTFNPGFQHLPGGLIFKWGTGGIINGAGAVAFAVAFPNTFLGCALTPGGASAPLTNHPLFRGNTTAAGFDVWGDATETFGFTWLAWGF